MRRTEPHPASSRLLLWALLAILGGYHAYNLGQPRSDKSGPAFFAQWGYILRYLAGQTPHLAVKGLPAPELRLFHAGELGYQFPKAAGVLASRMKSAIRPVLDHLEPHGVEVVLLPVPTKTSVYRSQLSSPLPETEFWFKTDRAALGAQETGPDELMGALFAAFPQNTVDLLGAYRRHLNSHPGAVLYAPLDYHWSTSGIAVAASEVVYHLRVKGWRISEPELVAAGKRHVGSSYLMQQFLLPDWYVRSRTEMQSDEPLFHVAAKSQDDRPSRIVVAGTSFDSSTAAFSLTAELSAILDRKTVNFAHNNAGLRGSFDEMYDSGFAFHEGDLLIWELPFCCLNLTGEAKPLPALDVTPGRTLSTKSW